MDNYVGEIRMFSGDYAPEGWHFCDGSLQSVSEYEVLFTLIGITYGGDGRTNFGLPDMRGRIPVGQGTGTGLTPKVPGQTGGTETVTLKTAECCAHSHFFMTAAADATSKTVDPTMLYAESLNGFVQYLNDNATSPTAVSFDARTVMSTGSSYPHDNMMPSQTVSFIIALMGLYPDRP